MLACVSACLVECLFKHDDRLRLCPSMDSFDGTVVQYQGEITNCYFPLVVLHSSVPVFAEESKLPYQEAGDRPCHKTPSQSYLPELPADRLLDLADAWGPGTHGHGPPTDAHLCTWSMLARNTLCDRRFLSMSVIWSPMVVEDRSHTVGLRPSFRRVLPVQH